MDKTFCSNLEDREVLFPPLKNVEGVKECCDFGGNTELILLKDALHCKFDVQIANGIVVKND